MLTMLYIDPGTGSMLFAILISVISAVFFSVKGFWVKIKFILARGKITEVSDNKHPLIIFSDDKRYWTVFKPICKELADRHIDVVYYTASKDDPVLSEDIAGLNAMFIGEGNRAFAKLNFCNANILLSTTPGLDVYQWKRSKNVDYYVHILHAANEIAGYRMFGVDYYDALLLSGEYQIRDARNLEKLRNLPAKDIELVGLPYMDEMAKRLSDTQITEKSERTILLAPSWGPSSIFMKFGGSIIDALIDTGYNIIIRPHPQTFTSEREMIESLMRKYPESDKLKWNRDNDNFDCLNKSDLLISDFSGVIFDFTLVYDKPVIYTHTEFDKAPYDAWWLDTPYWTMTALPRLGYMLTEDNLVNIKELIDSSLEDPKFKEKRLEVRDETWAFRGEGTKRTVDFLENKLKQFNNTREVK